MNQTAIPTKSSPPGGMVSNIEVLRETGAMFYERGWSLGTSSNYSVVTDRDPLELLITASGKDKGRLQSDDFVRVDGEGRPCTPDQPNRRPRPYCIVCWLSSRESGRCCIRIRFGRPCYRICFTRPIWNAAA